MRPCHERHPEPQTDGTCPVCRLYLASKKHKLFWDDEPQAPKQAKRKKRPMPIPCIHLGKPTGEETPCKTCTGDKMLPVMSCAVLGECTVDKLSNRRLPCCRICDDPRKRLAAAS